MSTDAANASGERGALGWPLRRRRGIRGIPLVWAIPGLLLALSLHYIAVGAGAWYAFTDWDGISTSAKWVGLENFRELLRNDIARSALFNTIKLAFVYVIVVNIAGLALALALNRTLKSRNFMRALFFAPVVLSPLATAYIWRYVFDFLGPLNGFLGAIGQSEWQRTWLGDPGWALWGVLVVFVWQHAGLHMAFYLAGLQGIPDDLDEAASVDGASTWLRLRAVTLPMLAAAMTISFALATIQALRIFDQVMALTGGGPGDATETLSTQLFKQGFAVNRFGYGAAFALILTVFIATVSLTQIIVMRRRETRL